jgi:transposase
LIELMIPPAKRNGRRREVLNAIFYVLSTDCQWKALPIDLPPKSAAFSCGIEMAHAGAPSSRALRGNTRAGGQRGEPTAAIIDSQSERRRSLR